MENLQKILMDVLYIVITGCAGALVAYIGSKIKQEVADKTESKAINLAVGAIVDAVNTVAMTYVDDLKKAGKFTPEAQRHAKEMAINLSKDLITFETKEILIAAYGDYEEWISAKIESVLKEGK